MLSSHSPLSIPISSITLVLPSPQPAYSSLGATFRAEKRRIREVEKGLDGVGVGGEDEDLRLEDVRRLDSRINTIENIQAYPE